MRYLLMIYGNEAALKAMSEEELRRLEREAVAHDEVLKRGRHLVVGHALEWPSQATALRSRGGRVVRTDGPFAETKEQLLGFLLIEAKDREEAVALASELPMLVNQTVEIRAVGPCVGEEFQPEHRRSKKMSDALVPVRPVADRTARSPEREETEDATPDRIPRGMDRRAQGASGQGKAGLAPARRDR